MKEDTQRGMGMNDVAALPNLTTRNQISPNRGKPRSPDWENQDGRNDEKSGDRVVISREGREKAESSRSLPQTKPATENEENKLPWPDVRKILEKTRDELRRQLLDSLRQHEKNGKGEEFRKSRESGGSPSFPVIPENSETVKKVESHETGIGDSGLEIDSYWNAENTSERIVNFAMQFADAHAGDPEGFVSTIRSAIEDGYSQALAITGPLPGAAGKATSETHRLTFEKLETRLAAWKATLYNQAAT